MFLNYQYRNILFGTKSVDADLCNRIMMDCRDLDACLKALVEDDKDILVRCGFDDGKRLVSFLKERYIWVKAAGGIVENGDGKRLIMVRNDRYDLPKGKVEDGESLKEAALRETNEETGLDGLVPDRLLLKTYHIYNLYGGWHFKQTSWFSMCHKGTAPLVPQTEEGITELKWLDPQKWHDCLCDSYATMRLVANAVL